MLTQEDETRIAEMIESALDCLGERMREIAREELAKCGYPVRPKLASQLVGVPPIFTEPSPLAESPPGPSPVKPMM